MVAWFIIAIATLGVFAFIAVNGVQTVAATTDGVGRVETARRLDAAVAAIVARSGSPSGSGKMLVLAGATVDGVYGLPAELSMYATTPFGQRIVYCPFGDSETGTAAGAVPLTSNTTYAIRTQADPTGRLFVSDGRPALPQVAENGNLMGYLIAPRTKTSPTPTCASVRYNFGTRKFEAPDAYVRAIVRGSSDEDQRLQAAREIVFYVSPSANGTARGLSPSEPTTLYNAITYYRLNMPQTMRIVMQSGNYVLPQRYMDATAGGFADKPNSGTLIMDGAIGGGTNLAFDGTGNKIYVTNNLALKNLNVAATVEIYADIGRNLSLENVSSGYLRIQNGAALQAYNIYVNGAGNTGVTWSVYVDNGSRAVFNGNVTVDTTSAGLGIVSAGGSSVQFSSATVTMRSANAAGNIATLTEENSITTWKNSSYIVNAVYNYPFLVHGNLSTYALNVTTNVPLQRAIEVQKLGSLSLVDSTFGLNIAPVWGIMDLGSSGVSGNATIRASALCWYNFNTPSGVQFTMSGDPAVSGSSSAVSASQAPAAMSANPTASEVQANADIAAANTMRQQLRSTNTSTYTCQKG